MILKMQSSGVKVIDPDQPTINNRTLHRNMIRAQREAALPAVSLKPHRMLGSGSRALSFFGLDVANDSIEHGHLSLLDRCVGIIDGQRGVLVQ
jgi:hypothetical protein